jgi:FtsP/CotA-like multicopper oxidase with cupredoxin domain
MSADIVDMCVAGAGDWRDTITLPAKGNVTIRWAADDYKGKSVAHCHDLTHADTGMVLNFQIV